VGDAWKGAWTGVGVAGARVVAVDADRRIVYAKVLSVGEGHLHKILRKILTKILI
jgi:hypothetical protein